MNVAVSRVVHWRDNSGVCHPAVSYGGNTNTFPTVYDLIQLDSLSLGVVVPTVRNNVTMDQGAYSGGSLSNLHCHDIGDCDGGP